MCIYIVVDIDSSALPGNGSVAAGYFGLKLHFLGRVRLGLFVVMRFCGIVYICGS